MVSLGLNFMRNVNFIELWLIEKDFDSNASQQIARLYGGSLKTMSVPYDFSLQTTI